MWKFCDILSIDMNGTEKWQQSTRAARLDKEIEELQRIKGLIPTEEDLLKYSLTTEEFAAIPLGPRIKGELVIKWQNAINGTMVVLRKRDAESPEMPIPSWELREAIRVFIDDDLPNNVALLVMRELERLGVIEYSKPPRHVTIVIPRATNA